MKVELEDKNREIKSLNMQIADGNGRVRKLENQLKVAENKLCMVHTKTPQAMREESLTIGRVDEIQALKDEIYHV